MNINEQTVFCFNSVWLQMRSATTLLLAQNTCHPTIIFLLYSKLIIYLFSVNKFTPIEVSNCTGRKASDWTTSTKATKIVQSVIAH